MIMKSNKTIAAGLAIVLTCCSLVLGEAPKPKGDDAAAVCAVKPVATVASKP